MIFRIFRIYRLSQKTFIEHANWNPKTTYNCIEQHCGSIQFQTGIGTAVLFRTVTTGTAGIAKTAGIGTAGTAGTTGIPGMELLELHGTAYFFNVSTREYTQFQCSFMRFS